MFTISVARLKKAPAEQRRHHLTAEIASLPGADGEPIPVVSPVELALTITNAGDFLWAVGEVKAAARLACSRCLKEFTQNLQGRFEEKYRLRGEAVVEEGEEIPVAADELDFTGHVIESLILSLPMKPLCAEDCLGLCPNCGRDLNTGKCTCPEESGDPRFRILAGFFEQPKGGGSGGSTKT
ncbi:MAG: DUF177 domain-containing protein [Bacillota bacterium]